MPPARKIQPLATRSPSRAVALAALERVLNKGQNLTDARGAMLKNDKLGTRDRAFAHLLLLPALRRLGQLDEIIAGSQKLHRAFSRECNHASMDEPREHVHI